MNRSQALRRIGIEHRGTSRDQSSGLTSALRQESGA
jgi:hypothetical protein